MEIIVENAIGYIESCMNEDGDVVQIDELSLQAAVGIIISYGYEKEAGKILNEFKNKIRRIQ